MVLDAQGNPLAGAAPAVLAPAAGAFARPAPSLGLVVLGAGTSTPLALPLLASPAATATPVTFSSDAPGVAEVLEAMVLVPAGSTSATFNVVSSAEGRAELTLDIGTARRRLTVRVGTPAAGELPAVLAPALGVEAPGP